MTPVDTATLAAHLQCTPGKVRLLVAQGYITPIGRWRLGRVGRPTMWFDLDTLSDQPQLDVARRSCEITDHPGRSLARSTPGR